MGVTVTVSDDEGVVGFLSGVTHIGELAMPDAKTMVKNVIDFLDNDPDLKACRLDSLKLSRLNVDDEGDANGVEFGSDYIQTSNFAAYEPTFRKLKGRFDTDGFVHLQHCEAAQNINLMRKFADLWQVPIVGGLKSQNPILRINYGQYVRVYPAAADGSRRPDDKFSSRP